MRFGATNVDLSQPVVWQDEADDLAQWAHERRRSSDRGLGIFQASPHLIFFYDSDPWPDDGGRARWHISIKATLSSIGIRVLASASYPEHGEDAGRTIAFIFDASSCAGNSESKMRLLPGNIND